MKVLGIFMCVTALVGFIAPAVTAEPCVGILLDGFQKDCIVHSKGMAFPCEQSKQLFKGDTITKLPNLRSLKIKWAPYASGKELDATTILVTFEPPEQKGGIAQNVKEWLGFVKIQHSVSVGATRSEGYEPKVTQPGNNATVISGQKITFVLESGQGKYIVFKDASGNKLFKRDMQGAYYIQLTPEEIGLKPSESYRWYISGSSGGRLFTIRLLGDEFFQQVTADLRALEQEGVSDVEKRLRKAAYLQLMSDAYPRDVDLYWLSYQLLLESKDTGTMKDEDTLLMQQLMINYKKHVLDTM